MPVRSDGRLNREEALHWIAYKVSWQISSRGQHRAREIVEAGYGHYRPPGADYAPDPETTELSVSYNDDGSIELYYIDVDGVRVVEHHKEAWQYHGFKSPEEYARWREQHQAA